VCVDATGAVQKVDVKQTSCFPRYDQQVADRMTTWHFEAGSAAVCGVLRFDYDQGDRRGTDGRQL
jgi:hypothetical protein